MSGGSRYSNCFSRLLLSLCPPGVSHLVAAILCLSLLLLLLLLEATTTVSAHQLPNSRAFELANHLDNNSSDAPSDEMLLNYSDSILWQSLIDNGDYDGGGAVTLGPWCLDSVCSDGGAGGDNGSSEGFRTSVEPFDVSVTVSSEDEDVDAIVGFDGSQKFPVKPPSVAKGATTTTQLPLQPAKIDRRHFKPAKQGDTMEVIATSALPQDLPKSPSRDVVSHRKSNWGFERSPTKKSTILQEVTSFEADFDAETTRMLNTSTSFEILETFQRHLEDEMLFEQDNAAVTEKTNITILGLFELTRGTEARPEGLSELQAAKLAVEKINEMGILRKFHLRMIHNDTKVGLCFFCFVFCF